MGKTQVHNARGLFVSVSNAQKIAHVTAGRLTQAADGTVWVLAKGTLLEPLLRGGVKALRKYAGTA